MRTSIILAVAALTAAAVFGDVPGTITSTSGGPQKGMIRWSARDKAYVITNGGVELQVKATDVDEIDIQKPAGYDEAVEKVNKGTPAAAIPVLEKIVKDYKRLQWDKPAGAALARAYIDSDKADAALKTCQDIISGDATAAYKGELAPAYWSALLALGKTSQLESALDKAFKTGDRYSSGAALLLRGDMILKDGNENAESCRKALVDGYLRVALLYKEESVAPSLRPEALYKAARCFEKLQMSSQADAFRSELKGAYATSPWATK